MDARFALALLLALACLNTWCGRPPKAATLPLTLDIVPRVAFEPAHLTARLTFTPDSANRDLCVLWDSPDASAGLQCWPPQRDATHLSFALVHDFEPGHYTFWAELTRQSDERTKVYATAPVDVLVQ